MTATWPKARLGELLRRVERPEAPTPGTTYRQLGVKLWGEGAYEREPMDGGATRYRTLSQVAADDVVVNKIWARNGSVAVVQPHLAGCFVSGEFPTFAANSEELLPRWMHWLTKTPGFWAQCDEKSQGTSGKNRIRPDQFLNVDIPLPPLAEQRRIVARIEALAAPIAEACSFRRQADGESEALMMSARTRFYDCTSTINGTRRLDDVCRQITDGTHSTPRYTESGVPFLSVKDITTGRIRFDGCRHISSEEHAELAKRCRPEFGDVLLTKVGTTGFAKAIDVDRGFSIFVSLALLKTRKDLLDCQFVEHMLNSGQLREHSAAGTRGVGNKNLVLKFIREFPMPVPPLHEQRRIVSELDALQAQVDTLKGLQAETAAELDALLPSILDRAFRGEM